VRPLIDRLDPERQRGSEAAPLARRLQQLMRKPDGQGALDGQGPATAMEELTRREVAILKRLESGLSN
jgi:DNA-binding NarL/FixJ family response regulator